MDSMCDKSELEKCLVGECYDCHAAVFLEFKAKARRLLAEYNRLAYEEKEKKRAVLQEMLGGTPCRGGYSTDFSCCGTSHRAVSGANASPHLGQVDGLAPNGAVGLLYLTRCRNCRCKPSKYFLCIIPFLQQKNAFCIFLLTKLQNGVE